MSAQALPVVRVLVVSVVVSVMAEAGGKPYLRSNLARTMYSRMMTDGRLRRMNLTKLYEVDQLALADNVRERFVQLSTDDETRKFLDSCFQQSEWIFTQIWHSVAKAILGMFMTQTSINGLLDRGRMFVWSTAQAKRLLAGPREQEEEEEEEKERKEEDQTRRRPAAQTINVEEGGEGESSRKKNVEEEQEKQEEEEEEEEKEVWVGERLLDLGAGDGHVTQVLAGGSIQVDVTEASPVMRKRLREKGYRVLDVRSWMEESEDLQYDVITCLNLLDRCDTPITLLQDIYNKLSPDGTLVVALVLPFSPYVEYGAADNLPSEELGVTGSTIEEQVNSLANDVFPKLGYHLERWSRLPYLCEGDLDQAFYWLSDVVLVLRKGNGTSDYLDEHSLLVHEQERGVDQKLEL